jgi:uncharacterized membrane protein (UPF0136 family)
MNRFNRISILVAAALIVIAVLLMLDGQILGEMTTNVSTVLWITALPLIVKSRKSNAVTDAQRASP